MEIENNKNKIVAFLLCFFGGFLGLHHFYLGNTLKGIVYLFTVGLFSIGWIIDAFKLLFLIIKDNSEKFSRVKNLLNTSSKKEEKTEPLIMQGYTKIYANFFINDKTRKLNIFGKEYDFSQIIDCELIEEGKTISSTLGQTKVKSLEKTNAVYGTVNFEVCKALGISITTNDFNNPRIVLNLKPKKWNISKDSKTYIEAKETAQNIISILKIIIVQNNEKNIGNGTITKI